MNLTVLSKERMIEAIKSLPDNKIPLCVIVIDEVDADLVGFVPFAKNAEDLAVRTIQLLGESITYDKPENIITYMPDGN